MDINGREKAKRFWIVASLLGICMFVTAIFCFFHTEKNEAEKRMVEIVNYVKVQCSTYTHYNESSESKSLLRAIESARQMSTNIDMEVKNRKQLNKSACSQEGVRYGRKNSSAYGTHQKPTTNSRTHPDSIVYHLGRGAWSSTKRYQDYKSYC